MTSNKNERSKPESTKTSSGKVQLVRPPIDFKKPPGEQHEAIRRFAREFIEGLKKQ